MVPVSGVQDSVIRPPYMFIEHLLGIRLCAGHRVTLVNIRDLIPSLLGLTVQQEVDNCDN